MTDSSSGGISPSGGFRPRKYASRKAIPHRPHRPPRRPFWNGIISGRRDETPQKNPDSSNEAPSDARSDSRKRRFRAKNPDPDRIVARRRSIVAHPRAIAAHPWSIAAHRQDIVARRWSIVAHPWNIAARPQSIVAHPRSIVARRRGILARPPGGTGRNRPVPSWRRDPREWLALGTRLAARLSRHTIVLPQGGSPMKRFGILACACCLGSGGCTWVALAAGNAYHMTIERAVAARVERTFLVRDAHTKQGVPDARVTVINNFDWKDDWRSEAMTDENGRATFKITKEYRATLRAQVEAVGYIDQGRIVLEDKLGDEPIVIEIEPEKILYREEK
jgi:hypothetical protein